LICVNHGVQVQRQRLICIKRSRLPWFLTLLALPDGHTGVPEEFDMASKTIGLLIMGSISLILFTALSFATLGQIQPGPVWLWTGWAVSLLLTAAVLWGARTPRSTWGYLSLVGGVISLVLLLVIIFTPISASAPYEPGADWLRAIDFTPSIAARLREALASAYFAIALIVLGVILFLAAYLLLRFRGPPKRHAH